MHGDGDEARTLKARGRFPIPETRIKLEGDEFKILETQDETDARFVKFVAAHPRCSFRDIKDGVGGSQDALGRTRDRLLKSGKILNVGTPTAHSYMASKGTL